MTSLLLDTCAAMWVVENTITQAASDALTERWHSNLFTYVSPITAWEVGLLASRGRFKSPHPPMKWFESVLALPRVVLAELPPRVLLESSLLPGAPPRDPADRIIAATAREFGFTVMTRDAGLLDYAKQGYLSAVAC